MWTVADSFWWATGKISLVQILMQTRHKLIEFIKRDSERVAELDADGPALIRKSSGSVGNSTIDDYIFF